MSAAERNRIFPFPANDFIATHLPDWLKNASQAALRQLHACVTAHQASQKQMSRQLATLTPLGPFANHLLQPAIRSRLGSVIDLDSAVWREARIRVSHRPFDPIPGLLPPDFETRYVYVPLLQKLLQNFEVAESFAKQTAVLKAQPASDAAAQVLTDDVDELVDACREVDVGGQYQQHLAQVLNPQCVAAMATDKRRELALAVEVAGLQGHLGDADVAALRQVCQDLPGVYAQGWLLVPRALKVLGCRVDGAVAFELLEPSRRQSDFPAGAADRFKGVIVYLPSSKVNPICRYADWQAVNLALAAELADDSFKSALTQRISLGDRAGFQTRLQSRLADARPDLEPARVLIKEKWHADMANWHARRIKEDALFLAVPTAQADSAASARRVAALESAGFALVSLAGLFVPVIGTLLLADIARQLLGHVYEGAADWTQGHQHEALEHMLEVATSVALLGAVTLGVHAARSAFVETLEPVVTEQGTQKLWRNDLEPYRTLPQGVTPSERHDGLFSGGDGLWWHDDGTFRGVYQDAEGTWRLLHRDGPQSFGPALRSNGERGWWLAFDRPQQWQGSAQLLTRLWPAARLLDAEQSERILWVAGVDEAGLRQCIVECRPLPVALRDTLERFLVQAQDDAFFEGALEGPAFFARFQWCVDRQGLQGQDVEGQLASVMAQSHRLRQGMLDHFAGQYLVDDPLLPLFKRHFPRLPNAYVLEVLGNASTEMRLAMHNSGRVPLALAQQARSLQQEARLVRLREALHLRGSYSQDLAPLVFRLLQQQRLAADQIDLVLHEQSASGPVIERLRPAFDGNGQKLDMVWNQGRFELYESNGRRSELEVAEPQGLFEVLAASLAPGYLRKLNWLGDAAPDRIRSQVAAWIPAERNDLLALLGWREARPLGATLQRLGDGRVGFPLGPVLSCLESPECALRRRIHSLYPSMDEASVEHFLDFLYQQTSSPYSSMLRLELEYDQLSQRLNAWSRHAHPEVRMQRLRVSGEFRRAWRMEGLRFPNQAQTGWSAHLSVISLPLGELPELPLSTDYGHIEHLTLLNLRLERLPAGFLSHFPNLQALSLGYNEMRSLPAGLENLRQLRELNLVGNRLRLSDAQAQVLASLTELRHLDLSDNPIGSTTLRMGGLVDLQTLGLRNTGLETIPEGLETCAQLTYVDLRNNQIASLPQLLIDAPVQRRQLLILSGNPLEAGVLEQLRAPAQPGQPTLLELEPVRSKSKWLQTVEVEQLQAREAQWDALRVQEGSAAFFGLLDEMVESADFRGAPQETGRRVWRMVAAANDDPRLRRDLFDLAADPRTCADSVAHCFSQLEVAMHVAEFTHNGAPAATAKERLVLARRLFRLDKVNKLARADMDARYADGRWVRGQHDEEEVEVSLVYRVGLAGRLNLLGQPSGMYFNELANVSEADLDKAYAAVLTAEASDERVAFISKLDFWTASLCALDEPSYAAIEDDYQRRWEALEEQGQAQHSNEAALGNTDYLQQARDLGKAREHDLEQLAMRLTRAALEQPV